MSVFLWNKLFHLNASSAVGLDKVHPRGLKACASVLAASLCIVLNKLFVASSLPKVWLESVVVSLFKSKSRYDSGNYHPVSLHLCVVRLWRGYWLQSWLCIWSLKACYQTDSLDLEAQINSGSDVVGVLRGCCRGG